MLTDQLRKAEKLRDELAEHERSAEKRSAELASQISEIERFVALDSALIDIAKIDLARAVIYVRGEYEKAGQDRASVITDAVQQIATSKTKCYRGLDDGFFGTKNYSGWRGQRSDHPYGYGPKHGSTVFEVGLTKSLRERGGLESLSDREREAALYLLTRIEAVQSAEKQTT